MRTLRLVAAVAALCVLPASAEAVTFDPGGSEASLGKWSHVSHYTDVTRGPDTGKFYAAGVSNTIGGSIYPENPETGEDWYMGFGYDVYSYHDAHVNRFDAAGAPDPTWYDAPDDQEGYTGDSFLQFGNSTFVYAIDMLPNGFSDGVPVVAGDGTDNGPTGGAFVSKWVAGGFNYGPIKTINPLPGCASHVEDLTVAGSVSPQILVTGSSYPGPTCDLTKRWIARLNSDLSLDLTFGNGGYVFTDVDMPEVLALPTGRILAIGVQGGTNGNGTVMRFLQNGAPDTEFGDQGVLDIDRSFKPRQVTVADDGSYYVAGDTGDYGELPAVVHVTQAGAVDRDFGNDGMTHLAMCDSPNFYSDVTGIAEQDDGKIVVGATGHHICNDDDLTDDGMVFRFHQDGTPDSTFGGAPGFVEYSDVLDEPGETTLESRRAEDVILEPGTATSPAGRVATVGHEGDDVGLVTSEGYLRRYNLGALASENTQKPGISGAQYKHGVQLTADQGQWAASSSPDGLSPLVQDSFQWLRCNEDGYGCAPIVDGHGSTFTPGSDEAGHRLRVRVRRTSNAPSLASATSAATPVINAIPPAVVHGPTIGGENFVGGTVDFEGFAEFTGTSGSTTDVWVVCTTTATDSCEEVAGSTDRLSYFIQRADVGKYVRRKSVRDNTHSPGGGTASAFSDAIGPILAPDAVNRRMRWNPATDFLRADEEPSNANPDAYGNTGVWRFDKRGAGLAHPTTNEPLPVFAAGEFTQHWSNPGDHPAIGLDSRRPGWLHMQPSSEQDAVLGFVVQVGGKLDLDLGVIAAVQGEAARITLYRGSQVVYTADTADGLGFEPPAFDVATGDALWLVVGHVPEVAPHAVMVDLRITTVTPAVFVDGVAESVADTTPTFTGTGSKVAGDGPVTLNLYTGNVAAGAPLQSLPATLGPDGEWTATAAALPDGHYTVQAVQSNASGQGVSPKRTFEVDAPTTGPGLVSAPVIDPPGTVVDQAIDVVAGTKLTYAAVALYSGADVQVDDSGWIRCPTAAMDSGCVAVGTEEDTYTTTADDVGKYVSFRELASNAAGSIEAKAIPRRVKAAPVPVTPTPTPTPTPPIIIDPPAPPTLAEILKKAVENAKVALGTPNAVPLKGLDGLGDFGTIFGGTNKPAVHPLTGRVGWVYCQLKLTKNAKCEFVLEPVVETVGAEVPLARAAARKKKARKIKLKKITLSVEPGQGAIAKLKISKAQRKAIGKLRKKSIKLKVTVKREGESRASTIRLPIKKK